MNFNVTYEAGHSINDLRNSFAHYLSPSVIRNTTARALNITATRTVSFLKKDIKQEYTINKKYLDRTTHQSSKANGRSNSGLVATVGFSYKSVPLIGFKHTGEEGTRGIISVQIKKGQSETFRHAFIKTMNSGHQGIFTKGRYIKGEGIVYKKGERSPKTGNSKISELRSPSFSAMVSNDARRGKTNVYVRQSLPGRLEALLKQKINKMVLK